MWKHAVNSECIPVPMRNCGAVLEKYISDVYRRKQTKQDFLLAKKHIRSRKYTAEPVIWRNMNRASAKNEDWLIRMDVYGYKRYMIKWIKRRRHRKASPSCFFASKFVSLRKKNLLILLTELEIFDIIYLRHKQILNCPQCGKINRYWNRFFDTELMYYLRRHFRCRRHSFAWKMASVRK